MNEDHELSTTHIAEIAIGVSIGVLAAKLVVQIIKAISA